MAVRPIDGTWSKFVWNLSKSESLARKFRDGKACLIDLRLAVEAQPTLTPPNEWVSVEERLSERNKRVLVHYSGGQVDIDCLDDLDRYRWESLYGLVTHWMPLPESPKKQEDPHV